eukprot:8742445-Lingulodinium_polyedra.AAC.1
MMMLMMRTQLRESPVAVATGIRRRRAASAQASLEQVHGPAGAQNCSNAARPAREWRRAAPGGGPWRR